MIQGAGAIIVKDGKVLLAKRNCTPFKGLWELPGGARERGESFVKCVKREIYEELGLKIKVRAFLCEINDKHPFYGKQRLQFFICEPLTLNVTLNEEVSAYIFVEPNKLPENIVPFHKTVIKEYFQKWKSVSLNRLTPLS